MSATDGMMRGMKVIDTGAPLSVGGEARTDFPGWCLRRFGSCSAAAGVEGLR